MMGNEVILTYKDVVLRRSDLDVLEGPCFLTDQVIGFYFGYLSSLFASEDILLVSPSVSFWLANCQEADSVKDFVEPLKLSGKKLVFFSVNNNDDVSGAESGTHWSLLVYDRNTNTFSHHDSMEGVNNFHAIRLFESVKGFMGTASAPSTLTKSSKGKNKKAKEKGAANKTVGVPPAEPTFIECHTPQQTNGYDCGLYVMAIAQAICKWYASNKCKESNWFSAVDEHVKSSLEMTLRGEVIKLIEELRDEA